MNARIKDREHLIDGYVGAYLRGLRQAVGMSQADLGSITKRSYQQIQKYESGQDRISSELLWQLAKIFQVKPDDFFKNIPEDLALSPSKLTKGMPAYRAVQKNRQDSEARDAMSVNELITIVTEEGYESCSPIKIRKLITALDILDGPARNFILGRMRAAAPKL